MSQISLTAPMRSNLLALQNIARQQDIVQNRLATGLKVSSAIDNPSSYYTAASLSNRAADLTALLDAMSQGVQTIKTASEAIDSATSFLEQAKATVSQALESAADIAAKVSTEEELLAAIASGKQGLIVLENDITMSENQSIKLQDGQSLVSKSYLNKNAHTATLTFTFKGITNNAIEAGNDSIISNLNINLTTDKRNENAAVYASGKDNVQLGNLDINLDTSTATGGGLYSIKLNASSAKMSGNININAKGTYTRGIYIVSKSYLEINDAYVNVHSSGSQSYLLQSYTGSVIDVKGKSQINLMSETLGNSMVLYNSGTINFYENSILNVQAYGAISGNVGTNIITFNDNSRANLKSEGTAYDVNGVDLYLNDKATLNMLGAGGFYKAHIYLQSAEAVLNIGTTNAFSATTAPVYITAVAGASFATNDGLYQATAGVNGLLVDNNSLAANFVLDNSKPAQIEQSISDMFNDFAAHMEKNKGDGEIEKEISSDQYNLILEQFDMLIADASYKGVNLLQGQNLKINFNEDRSSMIEVPGYDVDSESLGLVTKEWNSQTDIEKSISELENAINTLRSFASAFGNYYSIVTTRQDFTENLINVLEEGADKLTLADMNEEAANMLALQTSQQLAINSLSLASQAAQSVLKLF